MTHYTKSIFIFILFFPTTDLKIFTWCNVNQQIKNVSPKKSKSLNDLLFVLDPI